MVEVNTKVVVTLGFVIMVTWALKVLNDIWFRPKKLEKFLRSQGIKGNPYRIWHGDLEHLTKVDQQAHSKPIKLGDDIVPTAVCYDYQMVQKYGKRCFIWYGPNPSLLITDPDIIKDVMYKHNIFQKHNFSPLERLLATGVFIKEGDEWAKHRKIITPAFTLEKIKTMIPKMYAGSWELVKEWEKLIQEKGSGEVDVWPYLANLTGDVLSRAAFGSNYEEGQRIFKIQQEQAILTYESMHSNYIKGWRFLPTERNRRLKEIDRETDTITRRLISAREKRMKEEARSEDLLGILMESNLKEIQENDNKKSFGLSIEDVIEECKLFYFAGKETTSNLVVWTMIMLGLHQNWQQRAREEVFQVFGKKQPEFEELNHLKTLTMILYEVLRMFPPGVNIRRSTHEKTKIGDIIVPPGVSVRMNVMLVHYDPEIWGDDAREFNPERFSQGVANATKKPYSYLPFGMGPRICVGPNFALNEAKVTMSLILQHFSFEISPAYEHGPFPRFTIQPRYGAKMILHKLQ